MGSERSGEADGSAAVCARVLTRFVLKYTLRAQAEPSGAHEAVEGGTGHARDLGDGGLGNAQFEEAPDGSSLNNNRMIYPVLLMA